MKRAHKILFAASAAIVFALNPLESSAVLRMRVDGNGCLPMNPRQHGTLGDASQGLQLFGGSSGATGMSCSIPLGPDLVDLGDGNGHELATVNLRFHQSTSKSVSTALIVHDYDSSDFCTCGSTSGTNSGHFFRAMTFDCGSCAYSTSWAAGVQVSNVHDSPNVLTLKLLSVYDVN